MTTVRLPGIHMPDPLRHSLDAYLAEHVELLAAARRPATVRQGGMETIRSAFLVLKLGDAYYFLVERRSPDDGECWPTLFAVPDGVDLDDDAQIMAAVTRSTNRDAGRGGSCINTDTIAAPGPTPGDDETWAPYLNDVLWELLYSRTRDTISPDALSV